MYIHVYIDLPVYLIKIKMKKKLILQASDYGKCTYILFDIKKKNHSKMVKYTKTR